MFNTKKWGLYISRLRKNADMTQSELANKLLVTRQAISSYELGDSFPDVSILIQIASIFDRTLDELIHAGGASAGEHLILKQVATGKTTMPVENAEELIALAPLLKPSTLAALSKNLEVKGIEISHIIELAEYLNDENVLDLLEKTDYEVSNELIEKLIPLLEDQSHHHLLQKILDGEVDWHLIKSLIPYADYMMELVEAAVIEGVLPWEALEAKHEGAIALWNKRTH